MGGVPILWIQRGHLLIHPGYPLCLRPPSNAAKAPLADEHMSSREKAGGHTGLHSGIVPGSQKSGYVVYTTDPLPGRIHEPAAPTRQHCRT